MVEFLDLYADWCPPCKIMEPIFEELEKEFEGKVQFRKVNVDNEVEEAAKFKVLSIPTFAILKDGKEVDRKVGVSSKETLRDWINRYL